MRHEQVRYDRIGRTYARTRAADPAIAAAIEAALGAAGTILNVGAGTGSYEPTGRKSIALDPSAAMLAQRDPSASQAVRGVVEALPFASASFDLVTAFFTLHHWRDPGKGLAEMARVAPRQLMLLCKPLGAIDFWLVDYFPEMRGLDVESTAPRIDDVADVLDIAEVRTVLVPADCRDGFAAAYWNRPEAYLDPVVRDGTSVIALLPEAAEFRGVQRLRSDLLDGTWDRVHGHLRSEASFDAGLRLLLTRSRRGAAAPTT